MVSRSLHELLDAARAEGLLDQPERKRKANRVGASVLPEGRYLVKLIWANGDYTDKGTPKATALLEVKEGPYAGARTFVTQAVQPAYPWTIGAFFDFLAKLGIDPVPDDVREVKGLADIGLWAQVDLGISRNGKFQRLNSFEPLAMEKTE